MHIQSAPEAIDDMVTLINTLAEEKRKLGFVYQPPSGPATFRDDPYIRQKPRPVQKKRVTVGEVLPDVILKNEKGEDIRVADLAKGTGVVIFAVPQADTRKSLLQSLLLRASLRSSLKLPQLDATSRPVTSVTTTPNSRSTGSQCSPSPLIQERPRTSGNPRYVSASSYLLITSRPDMKL